MSHGPTINDNFDIPTRVLVSTSWANFKFQEFTLPAPLPPSLHTHTPLPTPFSRIVGGNPQLIWSNVCYYLTEIPNAPGACSVYMNTILMTSSL